METTMSRKNIDNSDQEKRVLEMISKYGAENIVVVIHPDNNVKIPNDFDVRTSKYVPVKQICFCLRSYFEPEAWLSDFIPSPI